MRTVFLAISISFFSIIALCQTGYIQEGKASIYADKFEGRTTASGERYYHTKSTCAHLSLPFGTLVRVTNTSNNQSVVVRVNDRGPFVPNRIIDLSKSTAEKLGFVEQGLADVRIEVLDESGDVIPSTASHPKPTTPRPPAQAHQATPSAQPPTRQETKPATQAQPVATQAPQPAAKANPSAAPRASSRSELELYEITVNSKEPGGYAVQILSFKELANLLRTVDELKPSLKKSLRVQVANINNEKVYRVVVGQFVTRAEGEKYREKLLDEFPGCYVLELK